MELAFRNRTPDESKNKDRKPRKIMAMHVAMCPKSDADELYLTRERKENVD